MNDDEVKYWSEFYKNNNIPVEPSSFCKNIFNSNIFDELYSHKNRLTLLDCGCGNGRDSYYFSKKFIVTAIDTSFKPKDYYNVRFLNEDFCNYDKKNYDIIYSRFTFHSITNEQQILFLQSIPKNSFLCIETRSNKSKNIEKIYGDGHYRNYTDYKWLQERLYELNFEILYLEENDGFAIYKNEDPICIRVICRKK
jgi:tellurite methyltransferase